MCTTAEKPATMGSQTDEVEMGKRSAEEATILERNVSNGAAAATEEMKASENLHQVQLKRHQILVTVLHETYIGMLSFRDAIVVLLC